MTALIPIPRQINRDSMTIADALATLIEAGFTVSASAELVHDGTEVRVTLSSAHHPLVRFSRVAGGVHTYVVSGVQVPFDTQSAVEYATDLLGDPSTWAVTR